MTAVNPYLDAGPVKDQRGFWDRKLELTRIFSRIGAGRPQCVSLVGEPRMGKTSLLNCLSRPELYQAQVEDPERFYFLIREIPEPLTVGPEEFMSDLSRMIAERTGASLADRGYEGFKGLMKDPIVAAARIVIGLDDFHRITENPAYPLEFFSFLRSVANNHNVAYVTTSPVELQRLCVSKVVEESPFFNIFTNIPLRPFPRDEARQAVVESSTAAGRSLEAEADRILGWAGAAPDDLRAACALVFERLAGKDRLTGEDWSQIEKEYLAAREPILKKRFEDLEPPARETMTALAAGKSVDRSRKYLAAELMRRGYVGKEEEGFPVLSRAWATYVASLAGAKAPAAPKEGGWLKKLFK